MKTMVSHDRRTGRISQLVADLPPSGIRRFFDLVEQTEGVISLGVGEPDFATPWTFSSAAVTALEIGRTNYTSNLGLLSLRKGIAANLDRRYGVTYDARSEVLVTVGVSEALDLACRSILNPGDEVIIIEPCFVSYGATVKLAYGVPVAVSTAAEDEFVPRIEAIEAAITPRTRAILVSTPSNPTGAVIGRQRLQEINELAASHDQIGRASCRERV